MIKPINEYVNTLISAKRYEIMNEAKIKSIEKSKYSKHFRFTTDKSIGGIPVIICVSGDDEIKANKKIEEEKYLENLDHCFNILKSNFSKIEKDTFDYLYSLAEDWEMNKNDIKKLAHLDYIEYSQYGEKKYFDIWYNSKNHGDRDKFFGNHSVETVVYIIDNKISNIDVDLVG